MNIWSELAELRNAALLGIALVAGIFQFFKYMSNKDSNETLRQDFENTLEGLYSENKTEKIASAILLRRFINKGKKEGGKKMLFKTEAINVIASLLRIEPFGEFQKTLADSLSYTNSLSDYDFQYANLQNLYLTPRKENFKSKNTSKVNLLPIVSTDFFMADLSFASLNMLDGTKSVFYYSNLFNTTFRNCILKDADFRFADLLKTRFVNSKLEGANFKGASNIPDNILQKLDDKGIYREDLTESKYVDKVESNTVFISCSANLSPKEELFISMLEYKLKQLQIEKIRYSRDNYRNSGQIGLIRNEISKCKAIIILGFDHISIKNGVLRPNTSEEKVINDDKISTPWNDIEAGIASALGLPILIISNDNIAHGIFDTTINDKSITRLSQNVENKIFDETLKRWANGI